MPYDYDPSWIHDSFDETTSRYISAIHTVESNERDLPGYGQVQIDLSQITQPTLLYVVSSGNRTANGLLKYTYNRNLTNWDVLRMFRDNGITYYAYIFCEIKPESVGASNVAVIDYTSTYQSLADVVHIQLYAIQNAGIV